MAAIAGGRIDLAVNAVATLEIAAMRHPRKGVALVLQRGFELNPGGVAIVAEALLMAHGADLGAATGDDAVRRRKERRMIEVGKGEFVAARFMTIDAERAGAARTGVGRVAGRQRGVRPSWA